MTEVTPNLPHLGNFCKYCFMGTLLVWRAAFPREKTAAEGQGNPIKRKPCGVPDSLEE